MRTSQREITIQIISEDLVIALIIGDIRGGKATALVPNPTRRTEHNIDKIVEKSKTCNECPLAAQPGDKRGVSLYTQNVKLNTLICIE